jgi:hypothetical protein
VERSVATLLLGDSERALAVLGMEDESSTPVDESVEDFIKVGSKLEK